MLFQKKSLPKSKPLKARDNKPLWRWSHIHLIFFFLSVCSLLTLLISIILYALISLNIPSIKSIASYQPPATTLIYSNADILIGRSYSENRQLVDLKQVPKLVAKAFVAAEDARFFEHPGVDGWSILRALIRNITSGSRGQGGSTITQQVARSLLLSPEKTYIRKVKEAILAYRIDKKLSKNEILHIYMNQIYLGEGAYGIGAAAKTYFGKDVNQLDLAEIAVLAGLPQAPSRYSPFKHYNKAKRRQAYVLNRMAEDGYISPTAARRAYKEALLLAPQGGLPEEASYFVQYVKNYLTTKYGYKKLQQGGLKIFTTVDLQLQRAATSQVRQGVTLWGARHPDNKTGSPEASLVCIDVQTGHVLALVGGVNFANSQFDRATQAKRQPGSAFKPLVYATAFNKGFLPNSIIIDEPITFTTNNQTWEPRNFSGSFYGPTTLRNALVHSRNIPAIKLLREIGVSETVTMAKAMGIDSPLKPNLSLALGSSELSLLELTSAYTVFANNGRYSPPLFIKKIIDRNGTVLEENTAHHTQVMTEESAFQTTYLLKSAIEEGTGKNARGIPFSAGKTGTTDRNMDAWFIGYNPSIATGVWVGHDQHISLGPNETGGRAAAPIWRKFMAEAIKTYQSHDFKIPNSITFIPINKESGDFEYLNTDDSLWEAFAKGNMKRWSERSQE
nr:penicillin-binding protein 1A [Desulfobulbaceae bacterium]